MALGFLWSFAYPVHYSGTTDTRVQFFHIINIENKKNLSYHQTRSSAASLHLLQEHHLAPDHGDRNAMLCILEATIVNSLSSSLFFPLFFSLHPHTVFRMRFVLFITTISLDPVTTIYNMLSNAPFKRYTLVSPTN